MCVQLPAGFNPVEELPKLDDSEVVGLLDPFHRYDMASKALTLGERERGRDVQRTAYRPTEAPTWLKHDRQVLRFYGFFQEAVVESRQENSRLRQCVIFFFLEDGSMMVTEPRVENSGIPQGAFLKRHRFPKPADLGGGFYQYSDIRCGEFLSVYSRLFRITGCDDYTKDFIKNALGVDFGQEESTRDDMWTQAQKEQQKPGVVFRDMCDSKQFRHIHMFGGARRNSKLEQFLENDGKVLQFKAYWDDESRYGARTYYVMHYYLADDSIEINESQASNLGRHPYPIFLKRMKLPRNPKTSGAPSLLEPEPDIYRPNDLIIGQSITVYNRKLVLYDCDEFTRKFYRGFMNLEQQKIPIENPPPVHAKLEYPPHNGIGSEEDSLASCLRIKPKAPPRDFGKLMRDSDKQLRFECVFETDAPEDENRKFVISMYLADETIGVYEIPVRNGGHWTTKFATKDRVKNPTTGTWYKPQDLYLGAVVVIKGSRLLITKADEGTLRYMEAECRDYPLSDVNLILGKISGLREALEQAYSLTPEDLRRAAQERLGVSLCEQELVTLLRAFGGQEPGGVVSAAALARGLR